MGEEIKILCDCGNDIFKVFIELEEDCWNVNSYCTECGKQPTNSVLKAIDRI